MFRLLCLGHYVSVTVFLKSTGAPWSYFLESGNFSKLELKSSPICSRWECGTEKVSQSNVTPIVLQCRTGKALKDLSQESNIKPHLKILETEIQPIAMVVAAETNIRFFNKWYLNRVLTHEIPFWFESQANIAISEFIIAITFQYSKSALKDITPSR